MEGSATAESSVRGLQMVLSLKALVRGQSGNYDMAWVLALELQPVANQCAHPGLLAGLTTMALSRTELGPDSR